MSLLSNRWENFLLSIINWTRTSFVDIKFFHVSSPIWVPDNALQDLILHDPIADPGNFVRGGGGGDPGQSDKKQFFFFSPQLILLRSNG